MSDELLCDPCRRLLRGENTLVKKKDKYRRTFRHHITAESFQEALAVPCGICQRIYAEFIRHFTGTINSDVLSSQVAKRLVGQQGGGVFQPAPTEYTCVTLGEESDADDVQEEINLRFNCGRVIADFYLWHEITVDLSRAAPPSHSIFANVASSFTARNTGSDACIDFALSQLSRCRETHSTCRRMRRTQGRVSDFMPTRILDVGYNGASTIHLVETEGLVESVPYIALSHCWGESPLLKLTRSTATMFRTGIQCIDLPKTFQDAIQVTRRMQSRYLWIDSLYVPSEKLASCLFSCALDVLYKTTHKTGRERLRI